MSDPGVSANVSFAFSYAAPTIQALSSTGCTSVGAVAIANCPVTGFNSTGSAVVLTIIGKNFGTKFLFIAEIFVACT